VATIDDLEDRSNTLLFRIFYAHFLLVGNKKVIAQGLDYNLSLVFTRPITI
jgi:hypothetical protein